MQHSGNSKIESFEDLEVWKRAHRLTLRIYKVSEGFPSSERFGLTSQIRRAMVSVVSNIAEGFGRWSAKDKIRFYMTAYASLFEVLSQLLLAKDLRYLADDMLNELRADIRDIQRLLNGLMRSIRNP